MKRFKYRLERVLHFRRLIEAEAKRELQLAQRELADAEARLKELEAQLVKEFSDGSEEKEMRAEEFLLISSYRAGLKVRIEQQLVEIETRRQEVVNKMAKYREAARELESLVRHRVTKVTEYDHEASVAEQAQIDELMVQRHVRR